MLVKPSEIKIKEGLERFRKDLGEIQELAESISLYGQLQPIVVNQKMELIAGGRRLTACTMLDIDVEVKVIDENDDLVMRELEVEENIQRKDFTPAEKVVALKDLHEIKKKLAERKDNTIDWSSSDTAEILGVSKSQVVTSLKLAEMVEAFPELAKCKTQSELQTASNAIMKLVDRVEGLGDFQEKIKNTDQVEIYNQDAGLFMSNLPDNSVDILLTDPPYGIDIADQAIGRAGDTGGDNFVGYTFDDSDASMLLLVEVIAKESYRFCKETAHAYVFCAPEYFPAIYKIFQDAGWLPWVRPIIWVKPGQGQSNMPDRWPVVSYEMCLYARRGQSKLLYARPDTLTYNRVPPSSKIHPTQKPTAMLQELITRSVHPGSVLVDPCMGSGSSLVAGLKEDLIVKGNDLSTPAYTAAMEHISSVMEVPDETKTD